MRRNRDDRDRDEVDDYTLLRGRDLDDDQPDADDLAEQRDADRRTKVVALSGLAAVVVILAVAIGLVSLIDTSSGVRPRSPHAAAQAWGDALVAGNHTRRESLECAEGSTTARVLSLVVVAARRVHAGTATVTASQRWSVPLRIDGPDGSSEGSVSLTVVRESGDYLVC